MKISMFYVILYDQRNFLYQQPNRHSTWRTPAALSLCTQEWHHKSILLQLRHYDIRHQRICFLLQKKKNKQVCICTLTLVSMLPSISFISCISQIIHITSEEYSEQNQKSPSPPNLLQLSVCNYPAWTFTTPSFKSIPPEMIWLFHDWTRRYV